MTFRDLSFWGLFNLILIVEHLITLLLLPIVYFIWRIKPSLVSFSHPAELNFYGISFSYGGADALLKTLHTIIILFLLALFIKTSVLWALGRYTVLGRLKLTRA